MRSLRAPLPRGATWIFAAAALVLFALAWFALRYPLTYCDSPGWAPGYVSTLFDQPIPPGAALRSLPATAFFDALGAVATRFHLPGAIGFAQGVMLLAALVALVRVTVVQPGRLSLVLLPALLASALRHAIYAQTLLSEPLTIALLALLVPAIVRPHASGRRAFGEGALATVLAAIRLDFAYVLPLLLARPLFPPVTGAARRRVVLAIVLGALVAAGGAAAVERIGRRTAWPIGRMSAIAEWSTITAPPRNGAARRLATPLVNAVAAASAAGHFRRIDEALPAAQAIAREYPSSWLEIARLMLYDLVNEPGRVVAHRAAVLHDLYATTYAAFWPEWQARSVGYPAYAGVFSRWTVADLDGAGYSSCSAMAIAQREYFQATGVAHPGACALLLELHRLATPYAAWLWRPLAWLALPGFLFLVWRRRATASQVWIAVLLGSHFVLRALTICADERYELPVDLLLLGWIATVLPDAIGALWPGAVPAIDRNASSPRR